MNKEIEAAHKELAAANDKIAKISGLKSQLMKTNFEQSVLITQLHADLKDTKQKLELAEHDAKVYKEQYLNAVSALKQ